MSEKPVETLDLERRIGAGESERLEFKKSTGQLNRAGETLCAFLNAEGGTVMIGVTSAGKPVGQEVSDKTEREIASVLQRFEPPAPIEVSVVKLPDTDRKLIVLEVRRRRMHARSLSTGVHSRGFERPRRSCRKSDTSLFSWSVPTRGGGGWENQPAVDVRLEDLDHEEIVRTREAAIQQRRISAGTSTDIGDILDRLGLRRKGVITQAA